MFLTNDVYKMFLTNDVYKMFLTNDVYKMFLTNDVYKIKTHFLFSIIFSLENRAFMRKCGKIWYSQTDNNMAYAHCMLNNYGFKHTLRICNTHCFSTTTMVARTRLIVTFIFTLPVLLILYLYSYRRPLSL